MKTISLISILILGIGLISCKKESDDLLSQQKIFFEFYYINFAWGLSYNHWIIDNEGNVRVNKKRDSIVWIDPSKLNSYVERFDSIIYKVDKEELRYYIGLIPYAAKGKIADSAQQLYDFGGYLYSCYAPFNGSYKNIVLSSFGDTERQVNMDTNAKKIDAWLKRFMLTNKIK